MLDRLRQLAIFAKTVETGSFRGAAKAFNLSPSVVSHHVSKLEDNLGVALMYRSTRKLSLTAAGQKLLASAREMLAAAESGLDDISAGSLEPAGRLKVTAPAVLAHSGLIDRIAAFAATYPKVDLDVSFTDVRHDIIAEGIDLAIRMGWLKDSSLKARKVASEDRLLLAAPSYFEGRRQPKSPKDLESRQLLQLSGVSRQFVFRSGAGSTARIPTSPQILVDDAIALYRLVRAGAGIGTLPRFVAADDLASGKILHVLPDWRLEPLGIYAVWPPNTPRGGLTSRFIGFLDQGLVDKGDSKSDATPPKRSGALR